MGFYSVVGKWLGNKRGAALAKIVEPHLEPGEFVQGWFIGMQPGRIGDKARMLRASAGGVLFQQGIVFRLPVGKAPVLEGERRPFRGAIVLTDRGALFVSTKKSDKLDAFQERRALSYLLAAGKTGDAYRAGAYTVEQGAIVTEDGTFVFDIPADSAAAFDEFCERLAQLRAG